MITDLEADGFQRKFSRDVEIRFVVRAVANLFHLDSSDRL